MNTLDRGAKGVYLITVTPFSDDGALDLASTDRMVDFYLERGATVCMWSPSNGTPEPRMCSLKRGSRC